NLTNLAQKKGGAPTLLPSQRSLRHRLRTRSCGAAPVALPAPAVCVHGARVTVAQERIKCGGMDADQAARGTGGTAEAASVSSDRRARDRLWRNLPDSGGRIPRTPERHRSRPSPEYRDRGGPAVGRSRGATRKNPPRPWTAAGGSRISMQGPDEVRSG